MGRAAALAIIAVLAAQPARAEGLVLSLSSHRVQITQTYTGAELVIFGAIMRDASSAGRQGRYDVVVTASGPKGSTVVREKVRTGPIWANLSQRKFVNVPATLAVLATREIDEVAEPILRTRYGLGLDALIVRSGPDQVEDAPFREALIRLKQEAGLYVEDGRGVTFITPGLFRATVPVPATAPVGTYDVTVALLSEGVQLARESTHFEVTKVGFEQALAQAARTRAWLYGLLTASMALLFGWMATIIFRRD
ncbi:TIGR02186 family protein [uncultured Alsobacter sp.]|uniref:TIGR02186 family protein n=1 Tax=uncultured Alsobacter sp. TaxID=1748258 RepID=UPI0025D5ACA4|nr:TIGR02186 family protein [uncultured Alsobacter sp.]